MNAKWVTQCRPAAMCGFSQRALVHHQREGRIPRPLLTPTWRTWSLNGRPPFA
jgi:hypothetical protein